MNRAFGFAKKNLAALAVLRALVFGLAATVCGGCLPRQGLMMTPIQYQLKDMPFSSGLRVVAEVDRRSPVVALVLVVGAGSTSDPVGKEGLAHYVEHLTFRSRPYGKSTMRQMLDEAGAGTWNATVGLDSTVFSEIGPKEALGQLLLLEAQRMANPVVGVEPAAMQVEMNVVLNELRQRNETGFLEEISASMRGLLFPAWHPYSRPTGGTHASLLNITSADVAADVAAFVGKHYRPDNMTLLIIGDIDLNEIDGLVRQSLPPQLIHGAKSNLPTSRLPQVAPAPPAPPVPDPSTLPTKEVAVATPELWVGWSLPRSFDADGYLVNVVKQTVGNALWSGEHEDEDIAFIETFVEEGKEASMLLCRVGLTRGEHPESSYEHLLNALSRVWTPGLSAKQIKAAETRMAQQKSRAIIDMVLDAEDISDRGRLRAVTTHFSSDHTLYSHAVERIRELGPSNVADFAKKYINRERARGMVFFPPRGGAELPDRPTSHVHKDVEESQRRVRADVERLQSILPGVGAAGFRRVTLANGLEVVLARRPGLPIVSAQLMIQGGTAAAPNLAAAWAALQLQWPTTVWHGEPEEVGARFETRSGSQSTTYSIAGADGNTEIMLAKLAERVQSLYVETKRWERFLRYRVPYIRMAENQAEAIGQRRFQQALFGGSAYGRSLLADDFAAVDAGKAQDWIDATHVPNNAVLVVVGDIEPSSVEGWVRSFFGDWKRGAHVADPVPAVAPGMTVAAVPAFVTAHRVDATQAQIHFGCLLPVVRDRATELRHDVVAELLRDQLGRLLRHRLGATYDIYADAWSLRGGTSYLEIRAAIENAHLDWSLTTIKQTVEDLSKMPVDVWRLERLKLKFARWRSTQLLSNDSIAGAIARTSNLGFALTSLDDEARDLAAVTPKQIQEDLVACMSGRPTLTIVGDEPMAQVAFQQGWVNAPARTPAPAKP